MKIENGNFEGVDVSDKSVDLSVAYTNLLAKYNALLKQVNNKNVRKFGIVYLEDITDDNIDDNTDDIGEKKLKRKVLVKYLKMKMYWMKL